LKTVFRRRVTSQAVPTAAVVLRRRRSTMPLFVVGMAGLALFIVIGMLLTRSATTEDPQALQNLAAPRTSCVEVDATAQQTRALIAKGELAAAVALAEDGLTQHAAPGCVAARTELARLWYGADLDALLATPADDEALSRLAPMRWTAIETRADELGVPADQRRDVMKLAQTAYDRGLWQLSDAAFRKAWDAGATGTASIEFRHALLRNWGHQLSLRGSATAREQGRGLLATAHAIARLYNLKSDVACTDLHALGVPDCSKTVPDPGEPTLAGARPGSG
jgi:hypothetical protein